MRPPPKLPAPDALVTKLKAIELLAQCVAEDGEATRAAEDKVRKRIDYWIERGAFPDAVNGHYRWAEVEAWAETQRGWHDAVARARTPVVNGAGSIALPGWTVSGRGMQLPGTIEACHEHIVAQENALVRLEQENAALRRKCERFRAEVAALTERCESADLEVAAVRKRLDGYESTNRRKRG